MKRSGLMKLFIIVLIITACAHWALAAVPTVFYSQLGYRPDEPKFFAVKDAASRFRLVNAKTNVPVFAGKMSGPIMDSATGLQYWRGSFTGIKQTGTYYLIIDGKERSETFAIERDVWKQARQMVLHSYYIQRCGTAIDDKTSKIKHDVCHVDDATFRHDDDAFHKEDDTLDVKGGWHDAGDYGKYVSSAGISVSLMLMSYELYPQALASDATGIPESGNGTPDLLDEVRWELNWMMKMQRPDGGVYHKVGSNTWPGGVLPEEDFTDRLIYGVSTSATAKFAATTAFASRIYQKIDPAYADKLRKAAELSWSFLMTAKFYPDTTGSDNSGSGPYGDRDIKDDLFWAATELYLTTGVQEYQDYAVFNIPSTAKEPSWEDGSVLALYHYASAKKDEAAVRMREMILASARLLTTKASKSAFGVATLKEEFEWSSNRKVTADSILLIMANRFTPNPAFTKVAYMQLHYIFGFNPLAKCFVSGIGVNPVVNPHQRLHWGTGIVPPGYLTGGPNNRAQSGVEKPNLGALSYADESQSYSSNEYAIDINASLLFVLASANQ